MEQKENIKHVLYRCGKYDEEREFRKIESEKKKSDSDVYKIIRNRD